MDDFCMAENLHLFHPLLQATSILQYGLRLQNDSVLRRYGGIRALYANMPVQLQDSVADFAITTVFAECVL